MLFNVGDIVMIVHRGKRNFEYPLINYEISKVHKKMFNKYTYDMIGETESGMLIKEADVPESMLAIVKRGY